MFSLRWWTMIIFKSWIINSNYTRSFFCNSLGKSESLNFAWGTAGCGHLKHSCLAVPMWVHHRFFFPTSLCRIVPPPTANQACFPLLLESEAWWDKQPLFSDLRKCPEFQEVGIEIKLSCSTFIYRANTWSLWLHYRSYAKNERHWVIPKIQGFVSSSECVVGLLLLIP